MNLQLALQQEYEMRHLPAIVLIRFDGTPVKWPEFIDSFHQNTHTKVTFTDNIRMARLISLLDGGRRQESCTVNWIKRIILCISVKILEK